MATSHNTPISLNANAITYLLREIQRDHVWGFGFGELLIFILITNLFGGGACGSATWRGAESGRGLRIFAGAPPDGVGICAGAGEGDRVDGAELGGYALGGFGAGDGRDGEGLGPGEELFVEDFARIVAGFGGKLWISETLEGSTFNLIIFRGRSSKLGVRS